VALGPNALQIHWRDEHQGRCFGGCAVLERNDINQENQLFRKCRAAGRVQGCVHAKSRLALLTVHMKRKRKGNEQEYCDEGKQEAQILKQKVKRRK
jgi:hypothetical protein